MTHPAAKSLPDGWFHHADQILALLEQHRPKVIVELGTYLGASAIGMARVSQAWGGTVYCVDTWAGRPQPGRSSAPLRLFACATNMRRAKVHASVRLIPATTLEAAKAWQGPPIDCLYVDADHSYEGCLSDLQHWTPHLRQGALLMGDDYDNPMCPGVAQAWTEFEAIQQLEFQRVETSNTNPPGMKLVYGVWR